MNAQSVRVRTPVTSVTCQENQVKRQAKHNQFKHNQVKCQFKCQKTRSDVPKRPNVRKTMKYCSMLFNKIGNGVRDSCCCFPFSAGTVQEDSESFTQLLKLIGTLRHLLLLSTLDASAHRWSHGLSSLLTASIPMTTRPPYNPYSFVFVLLAPKNLGRDLNKQDRKLSQHILIATNTHQTKHDETK